MIDRCEREDEKIRKFKIERQNRWMLPASCIIFLFLGASLGAIIRKGGIGVPVIFSILFFIIFYIFMIQGRKLARDEILPIWIGAWLPVLLMCPLAIFTTWQSVTESKLLYGVSWYKTVRFFLSVFPFMKRKQTKPDVLSVEERIAQREKSRGDALRAYEDYESNK
jgi:lipopolysaccharide export system permease protein